MTASACGAWPSAVTSALVVESSVRLGQVRCEGDAVWWDEMRPNEGGRTQIVRRSAEETSVDVLPVGWSASSRVHEYGGGSFWVHADTLFFVNDDDQRIWRLDPGQEPRPITPEPPSPRAMRYADGIVTPDGVWIVCVQEDHTVGAHPANRLVAIPAGGGDPLVLFDASDFVSSPRVDATTGFLAFLAWDHPDMPWDSARLWVGHFDTSIGPPRLIAARVVAGGSGDSICQPEWDPDGRLWFVSDRTDWWNLYRFDEPGMPTGEARPVDGRTGEVGEPAWIFGQSRYAFLSDGRVVFAETSDGVDHLGVLDERASRVDRLDSSSTEIAFVTATATTAVYVGSSFTAEAAIHAVLVGRNGRPGGGVALRPARELALSSAHLSTGHSISFPTGGGHVAHALFYPPANPDHEPPQG